MAINKKLIFWNNQSNFSPPTSSTDTTKSVLWQSIVFFNDTKKIWTHGVYFSNPLDTLLSGYSVGTDTALAASDTILGAFGKIQAQLNAKQVSLPDIPDLAGTYTKVTVSAKGLVTAGSNPTTLAGYGITDAYTKTQINGFLYTDTRTITPTTWGPGSMQFGFTSKTLNNVGNWADFIRFGGYTDSTGGRENIILFFKDGFGLRQYQGDFNSESYNHGYVDYWHSGNFDPASKNASLVTSTTAAGVTNTVTGNTNTYLNIVQGGASIGSSTQITGAGSITVSSDAAGKLTITGNTDYLPLTGGTITGQINLTTTTITTPPANTIALAAKSDGLYQKIGTVETKLALTTDLTWANIISKPIMGVEVPITIKNGDYYPSGIMNSLVNNYYRNYCFHMDMRNQFLYETSTDGVTWVDSTSTLTDLQIENIFMGNSVWSTSINLAVNTYARFTFSDRVPSQGIMAGFYVSYAYGKYDMIVERYKNTTPQVWEAVLTKFNSTLIGHYGLPSTVYFTVAQGESYCSKLRFTFKCTVQGAYGLNTLFPYYNWGSNLQDYRINRDGNFLFSKSVQAPTFIGALTGNAATSTKSGNSSIWFYAENSNEINFGGSNTSTSIYFGYRAKDSRAIPTEFIFGGGGTATLKAAAYNENGTLLTNKYLQLSGGTLTGKVTVPTATRSAGMYGVSDSTKIGHIWSMGTGYAIDDAGAGFGSLYGMAYKHTNNTTGGTMAGGHQIVFANAGVPNAAIGLGGNFWTTGGFIKSGSSDSYVLLGGGGHSLISSLSVSNADTVDGQHFSWSNTDNNPTYLWGANSNGTNFLVARGSMSVNYATSAGSTNSVANSLILKFDTGIVQGTDLYTFNGSAEKTIDFKAGSNITLTKSSGSITISALDYMVGRNTVTTLASLPINKRSVLANVTTATSLSLESTLPEGQILTIKVYNTSGSSITQPLPTESPFESKKIDGSNLSSIVIAVGGSVEISIWSINNKYIIKTDG